MNREKIVEAIPLRDQVADIIRQKILRGELEGDEPISERSISESLNISTTPVKEAFRMLEAERLIYVKPRKGSYVSNLSKDFMQQLVFMRGAMEGVAAYYATLNIKESEISLLENIIRDIETKIEEPGNSKEISKLNAKFHSLLRGACRNEYLVRMIESMRSIDKTIRELSLTVDDQEPVRAFREHKSLLEALKAGDPSVTEQRMVCHVRRVAVLVLSKNKE